MSAINSIKKFFKEQFLHLLMAEKNQRSIFYNKLDFGTQPRPHSGQVDQSTQTLYGLQILTI